MRALSTWTPSCAPPQSRTEPSLEFHVASRRPAEVEAHAALQAHQQRDVGLLDVLAGDSVGVVVGGGGLLRGLAERIERETQVPVRMSNVPLEAVVLGAGHVIEHYEALKGMFMGARR